MSNCRSKIVNVLLSLQMFASLGWPRKRQSPRKRRRKSRLRRRKTSQTRSLRSRKRKRRKKVRDKIPIHGSNFISVSMAMHDFKICIQQMHSVASPRAKASSPKRKAPGSPVSSPTKRRKGSDATPKN